MRKFYFLLIFVCFLYPGQFRFPVSLQTGPILVVENSVDVSFPRYIDFNLTAQSDTEINQVVLVYSTSGRTCVSGEARQELEFEPAKSVVLNWEWDLIRSSSFPPGAEISWRWEIRDASGNSVVTEAEKITVEDTNYAWQSLKNSAITLFWAEGDAAFGKLMMNLSQQSLERLEKKAGLSLPEIIKIYIYPSAEEIKSATLHMPDWIGGLAYSEYDTTLIAVEPQYTSWASTIIPHELSHLVTGWRVYNCRGGAMPTWLNEGLARFAEGAVSEGDIESLKKAIQNGNVPGLQGLAAGFAASAEVSAYEYTYSGMVVTYLIEKFGVEKMDALLGKIKEGSQIDPALRAFYGLDTVGLDKSWRASLGLLPAAEATIAPSTPTQVRTQVPTLSLWTAVVSTPQATFTDLPTAVSTAAITPEVTVSNTPAPTALVDASTGATPAWIYAAGGLFAVAIAAAALLFFLKRTR